MIIVWILITICFIIPGLCIAFCVLSLINTKKVRIVKCYSGYEFVGECVYHFEIQRKNILGQWKVLDGYQYKSRNFISSDASRELTEKTKIQVNFKNYIRSLYPEKPDKTVVINYFDGDNKQYTEKL